MILESLDMSKINDTNVPNLDLLGIDVTDDHFTRRRSTTETSTSSDEKLGYVGDSDEEIDPEVAQAVAKSIRKGSIMPILKQELRCSIQNRRLATGNAELVVEYKSKPTVEYTPEEEDRRKKRRENNKRAAQRCRDKRRDRTLELEKETSDLQSINTNLKDEVQGLEHELEKLRAIILGHNMEICPFTSKSRELPDSPPLKRVKVRQPIPRPKAVQSGSPMTDSRKVETNFKSKRNDHIVTQGSVRRSLVDHDYVVQSTDLIDSNGNPTDVYVDIETVEEIVEIETT